MIMKKIMTLIMVIAAMHAGAQIITPEVIASGGGSYENDYAFMDVTIGEVVTETMISGNYILTNGFQQGHYNIDFIENNQNIEMEIQVYPNPANEHLFLSLNASTPLMLQYHLCDLTGRVILHGHVSSSEKINKVNIQSLVPGTYYISFLKDGRQISRSFKIIKM